MIQILYKRLLSSQITYFIDKQVIVIKVTSFHNDVFKQQTISHRIIFHIDIQTHFHQLITSDSVPLSG